MNTSDSLPSLSLPLDVQSLSLARMFAQELARQRLSNQEKAAEAIGEAVTAACRFLIENALHAGSDGVLELFLNTDSVDFDLVVRNLGVPADVLHATHEGDGLLHWLEVRHGLSRVYFKNCGKSGQQIHLLMRHKHADVRTDQAFEHPTHPPGEHTGDRPYAGGICIRRMRTGEALEVARCAYDAYGYSYVYETIYVPERFEALNQSNSIRSFVAVDDDGNIAGHASLVLAENHPGLADLAMVMTRKHYRGHNIATRLADACIEEARQSGLAGVYIESVTSHVYTQKFSHKLGMKDCGFLLAHAPASLSFKGIDEDIHPRQSIVLAYLNVDQTAPVRAVFAPADMRELLQDIYSQLGLKRSFADSPADSSEKDSEEFADKRAEVHAALHTDLEIGTLEVRQCGQGAMEQIASNVRGFIQHGIQVVECFLCLDDPGTPALYEQMLEHRFFVTGVLPNPLAGDKLVLQRLEGIVFDSDALAIANPSTRDLLEAVTKRMPDSI